MNESEKVTHLPVPAPPVMRESHPVVTFSDMQRMAESVAKSGLFGVKTPEQAISLMLIAQAEGLHPAIAARDYDIIQGRPSKKSEAMMRSFIANGGRVRWHQLDDTCADATFSHPAGGEVRIVWDMRRAATAGLSGKDNYKKFPRQMLRSRCISEGVRTVCPMATSGMYVPEEVADMEPAQAAPDKITAEQVCLLEDLIRDSGADRVKFLRYLKLERLEDMVAPAFGDAKAALELKLKAKAEAAP